MAAYAHSGRAICEITASSFCKDESETPNRRTAFGKGINFWSSPVATRSSSDRLRTGSEDDWLRETISKSANLTFSVTVRPRLPVLSQCARPYR